MKVHLYAQCWNDEWMLPYFFRHYDQLVDTYFIFDDNSSDQTLELLGMNSKVVVSNFERSVTDSFVLSEQIFSNSAWKQSRDADWVIVIDIDEHLYRMELVGYLRQCLKKGVTLIPTLGFQMISDNIPKPEETLCEVYREGAPWVNMMKPCIFRPDQIDEINFRVGRHTAEPCGNVVLPSKDELLLLHYKYLGFERVMRRHQQLRMGLGEEDLRNGWGHKYSYDECLLREDWESFNSNKVRIDDYLGGNAVSYPIKPWWAGYTRAAER